MPHSWSVTPKQAAGIQTRLADRVVRSGRLFEPRLVAGTDLAFSKDKTACVAGVVVWDLLAREVVEQHVVRQPTRFPYVPGLLSFREAPALVAVLRKLRNEPDVFMFDGQGFAHPRRFGLACHVGVLLDRPSVGCAKSRLIGSYREPGLRRGSYSLLHDGVDTVGAVLRTRDHIKPLFISVGHRLSLDEAVHITLACGHGYRLPEPTRRADRLVARRAHSG